MLSLTLVLLLAVEAQKNRAPVCAIGLKRGRECDFRKALEKRRQRSKSAYGSNGGRKFLPLAGSGGT